jgi:hypothetical protein
MRVRRRSIWAGDLSSALTPEPRPATITVDGKP